MMTDSSLSVARHMSEGAGSSPEEARDVALPFLKWPGGKRWAAKRIAEVIAPHLKGRYYEPFLGGGAVFFHLRPERATLGDVNPELIAVYEAIRDSHCAVVESLQMLPLSEVAYAQIRSWRPRGTVERAARFLYLNRTAFGGIYRLNQAGQFNVPYGGGKRTPAILWETDLVERAAEALVGVTLRASDFGFVMRHAREGDVVYCDPTYTVAHENNGFVRYNERNFSWADQQRLAGAAYAACERGVVVVISNAHHESVRALYRGAEHHTLERTSCVSTIPQYRKRVHEYLIVLRP